ncbi:ribosomal protein S6 kinase delta-1 isoform X3 [Synchiropus splendidus]|uniref:ribosomal protein S6 kinase delta-1 isoform X3 n=1 Tax=Synchiropus splendidus TaxID=270530 RepID=UPI00237E2A0F|nr:ribosomal protein S6 kinase delta-1 isoform X3 [Synchiropus splendidus]
MKPQPDRGDFARFYTVTDPEKHQKGYTVYKVTARIISRKNPEDVQEIIVWKRYSDFRKLHQNLLQLHKSVCNQSELFPPFAKAKVFGRFDDTVIEERRQCSEDLLQFSANIPALYNSQHIQEFFKGGKVHDGSELIGPAEPFLDFLADSISDCSSEVQRDASGADDLTVTSEYGGEASPTRRDAVKKKTAEYLMRAEQISSQYLKSNMGQGSTQKVVMGAQCCQSTSRGGQQSPSKELEDYRVLGVIDKVLLVMDKNTQETFILKGLRKSSDCGRIKKTIMPHSVPHMVQLRKFIVSEDTVFLLLQYAEGGKLWSHIGKYLRNSSPDESFDIPFIQKSHTAAIHSPQSALPHRDEDPADVVSGLGAASDFVSELKTERSDLTPEKPGFLSRLIKQIGAQSDSGATSEEECTNSYLTLCNEYEQEKVDPLNNDEDDEKSEQEMLSLEVPIITTTTTSSRSRSLLSNDSLSSPISSQELGFFTESSDKSGQSHDQFGVEGQDNSEVFSSLPSPAVPLSLDQSKHTPMEFFRIDSKDSASEVSCFDWGEKSHKQVSLFSTSDLGSDVTEDLPELAQEAKGHCLEIWGFDCSDKVSNESVPVISFQEAVDEEEGQPPDLLVNLPVVSSTVDSLHEEACALSGTVEATDSPQKSIQPDVLQLHTQSEEDVTPAGSSSFLAAEQDEFFEQKLTVVSLHDTVGDPTRITGIPSTSETSEGAIGPETGLPLRNVSGVASDSSGIISHAGGEIDKVSRLFAELDELSLAASQARIPEAFVRCWAAEMVTALDSLHQDGVTCRDLNPNNILIDHQGHIQLTYFCSWTDVEDTCDKDASLNMYCAPEVGGISEETTACDWWSLGAILFELLTGMTLLRCHPAGISRHTTLNIPEFVSEEARSLLEQLLQYNPVERLGAGVAGSDDIKSHPFFATVDWPK